MKATKAVIVVWCLVRQVVSQLMATKCRCHGVSGSCAVRTCWKSLPAFRRVGDALKSKYEQSVEISPRSVAAAAAAAPPLRRREKRMRRVIVQLLCSSLYIHSFNGHLSGTIRVSRYQKGKTNLHFTEARDSE